MSWPWIVWWFAIFASFAVLEAFAFKYPSRENTLSYCMAWLGAKFPLSIGMIGLLIGGLFVHFFWHYCPFPGDSMGALKLAFPIGG